MSKLWGRYPPFVSTEVDGDVGVQSVCSLPDLVPLYCDESPIGVCRSRLRYTCTANEAQIKFAVVACINARERILSKAVNSLGKWRVSTEGSSLGMNSSLLACLAGLSASLSSLFLKLGSSAWYLGPFVLFNLGSLSLFSASLRGNASLAAASISISTNLAASTALGVILLREEVTWHSWLGVASTALGAVLIQQRETERDTKKKQ